MIYYIYSYKLDVFENYWLDKNLKVCKVFMVRLIIDTKPKNSINTSSVHEINKNISNT